jgi:transcriptional antiterminator RfaH
VVPVPDSLVSLIMSTSDPETGVHTTELNLLNEGDKVVLTDGPLANLQAIFRAADGDARAIILLKLLGQETEVAVPMDQISRIA